MPGRQRDDQIAMNVRRPARCHDQTAIGGARERRDGALDLVGVAHVDRVHLHPERRRHGLDDGELAGAGGLDGIPKDGYSRHTRRDLFEQLQPFPADAVFKREETGRVATGPRQAIDVAGADRIGDDREYDRHGAGRLEHRPHGRVAVGQDTSGASATNSAACLRISATLAVAQRVSIFTLRPMVQPRSACACRQAPTKV